MKRNLIRLSARKKNDLSCTQILLYDMIESLNTILLSRGTMYTKLILTASLFIAAIAIVSSVQPVHVMGQSDTAIKTVILRDDAAGNERGWDPDGMRTTFWIYDDDVTPTKSTVLVNTIQGNFVTCSVDWMSQFSSGFEVNCINDFGEGPADGGELHYTVFNSAFTIDPTGPLYSEADLGNLTASLDVMTENRTALAEGNTTGG
jgi:hypothetical protein